MGNEEKARVKRFKELRETFKELYNEKDTLNTEAWARGYKGISDKDARSNELRISAYARRMMEAGVGRDKKLKPNTYCALLGAQLYEKIGKGKKAIPKLLIAARKDSRGFNKDSKQIEAFIERNSPEGLKDRYNSQLESLDEGEQDEGGLAGRVGVFALFVVGGLILSFSSLAATGNVISSLTRTTPGLLGVILFIAGLVGMFFYLRRR